MPGPPRLFGVSETLLVHPCSRYRGDRVHNRQVVGNKAAGVEGTARAVADITKCVSIVGAVFSDGGNHCEMNSHGVGGFSRSCIFARTALGARCLLNYMSECAMIVVDPEAAIDDIRLITCSASKKTAFRLSGILKNS